jgi:hypothetical protein
MGRAYESVRAHSIRQMAYLLSNQAYLRGS